MRSPKMISFRRTNRRPLTRAFIRHPNVTYDSEQMFVRVFRRKFTGRLLFVRRIKANYKVRQLLDFKSVDGHRHGVID